MLEANYFTDFHCYHKATRHYNTTYVLLGNTPPKLYTVILDRTYVGMQKCLLTRHTYSIHMCNTNLTWLGTIQVGLCAIWRVSFTHRTNLDTVVPPRLQALDGVICYICKRAVGNKRGPPGNVVFNAVWEARLVVSPCKWESSRTWRVILDHRAKWLACER